MSKALQDLKEALERGNVDPALLAEAEREHREVVARVDQLEELLIMIVRTGWPWDEEGEPNAIFHAARDGFATSIAEAREILGIGHRSHLTRTEPRT